MGLWSNCRQAASCKRFTAADGTTNKVWVSESDDDGLTWTYKADIYSGPLRVSETSAVWISGSDDATSTLVAVSRNESGGGLLQFVSRDGGSTWTNQGLIPGGNRTDVSPWLHRLSDGTLVNAWHERSWFSFNIRMGPAGDVAANPSNWGPVHGTYPAGTRSSATAAIRPCFPLPDLTMTSSRSFMTPLPTGKLTCWSLPFLCRSLGKRSAS